MSLTRTRSRRSALLLSLEFIYSSSTPFPALDGLVRTVTMFLCDSYRTAVSSRSQSPGTAKSSYRVSSGHSENSIDTMSVLPLDEPLSNFRQSQDISRSVSFISSIIVFYACTIICCTARLYLKATRCVMLLDDCRIISTLISQ